MARVLVTGGNGFVAVHVIEQLLARGHSVVTTVRSEEKTKYLREKFSKYGENLKFSIVPDMSQSGAFDDTIKSYEFDAVLHTSSPFTFNIKDPKTDLLDPAIQGTRSILESVKNFGPSVQRVVVTSSFASIVDLKQGNRPGYVYSEKDWNPVTYEEALTDPVLGYYGSKTFAERAAWEFIEQEKPHFKLTTLCPPMVFGPPTQEVTSIDKLNTSNASLYAMFIGKAKAENSVWIWVDVRDLALAHVLAFETNTTTNERYLITQGTYSAQQVLEYAWQHYPDRARAANLAQPAPYYPEEGNYRPDNSKSKQQLNMEYRSFEDMLKDTFPVFVELEKL
ncbi:methylglyoxal reductase (NADPH-dependent) gre2 [Tulasnella sp. 419]|nr:methylglyoxal reductase (NADPH-dependent) gre2 [Tulasnella sp. 418]KAG8960103.1 methylglyoxal reductase (NADPH-dependent) gre2 [Tulasnella sp. 419]